MPLDERLKRTASDIPVMLGAFELLLSGCVESHHRHSETRNGRLTEGLALYDILQGHLNIR